MSKLLSVIIPHRNCPFVTQTINDVLNNAGVEVEVLVNVDEKRPSETVDDPRVKYYYPSSPLGLRGGINFLVSQAVGKYILKCDDHVAFGENFGKALIEAHQDNWVQIPRRYALDAKEWEIEQRCDGKYPIDVLYLDFPKKGKAHDWGLHGVEWRQRREKTKDQELVETMSFQGSCYFMTKDYFYELGIMDEKFYGQFSQEAQEIGFKTWLGGGKLIKNKRTWYAHLHKGNRYGKMYNIPGWNEYTRRASNKSAYYWMENKWRERKHDIGWLIDRFWPVRSWPKNWQEIWDQQVKEGWPDIDYQP